MAHLETVAMDLRVADRLPFYGPQHAMPALLAEGRLTTDQATALLQYCVDAVSFNRCLDLAQEILAANADAGRLGRIKARRLLQREVKRTRRKAGHLVHGTAESRFDPAIEALRQAGFPAKALARIPAHVLVGHQG